MKAIEKGDLKTVNAYIEGGGNLKVDNGIGGTALHTAAGYNQKSIVEALIKAGLNLEAKNKQLDTPLTYVAQELDYQAPGARKNVIEVLLKANADVNAKNNSGETALSYATKIGRTKIVALLKKYGAKE